MFKYKPQLLFHHTARFPWHPLFLNSSSPSLQCQECPRSILSGMCPVCTTRDVVRSSYPPGSSQDLKDLQETSQGNPKLFAREIFFQFPDHGRCRRFTTPPLIPRSKGLTGTIPRGNFEGGAPTPGFHPISPKVTQFHPSHCRIFSTISPEKSLSNTGCAAVLSWPLRECHCLSMPWQPFLLQPGPQKAQKQSTQSPIARRTSLQSAPRRALPHVLRDV